MGRKPIFDVKSLEIGQKLRFPKRKKEYIYQYLNNFHRSDPEKKYQKVEKDGKIFILRVE